MNESETQKQTTSFLQGFSPSSKNGSIFVTNGLLGSAKPTTFGQGPVACDPALYAPPILTPFIANGLLAGTRGNHNLGVSTTKSSGSTSSPANMFVLDALRPDTQSSNEHSSPALEAFGISSGLLTTTPALDGSSSSPESLSGFFIRAITFDGKFIGLRRKPRASQTTRKTGSHLFSSQKMGNLLDVPIHKLMDELSAATATELTETARAVPTTNVEDILWVDRYRPQKFTELTGNDRVARETMAWVKQWDWCVFGRRKGKKRLREDGDNSTDNDEYRRPREKILLLSGPPGLGKTTLAHVVARHAGYEVMEINASDARTGSVIDERIRPALESGFAIGSTKPVLLVIDEIDGATGTGDNSNTFIHKLIQLTLDKSRSKHKKNNKTRRPILRPIICICNDQNASALIKLKLHAYHIRLQRPADIHTLKRLREICVMESLNADSRALTTLVGVAKGDLRGCLNTLQFIKSRADDVTEEVIRRATAGMKDNDASLTSVLNNLFNPLPKKRVKELGIGEEEERRYVARLSQEIDESGKESSIALGCFGHYATLRQHDANFSRFECANEWLLTYELLASAMYNNGDFALAPYLPYALVAFYPLFQERGGPRVERNQLDWDSHQITLTNEEVLKTLSKCLKSASLRLNVDFRHLLCTPTLQLEFVPMINRIINPPLRPVNSQVIRPEEKAVLARLVDIMVALELRFLQERAEDGQLSYRLEPPIDVFVTYDGKRAPDINMSRYAVRRLVASEIDAQLITRDAEITEMSTRNKPNNPFKQLDSEAIKGTTSDGRQSKQLEMKGIDIADKLPTDFFGRVIPAPLMDSHTSCNDSVGGKFRVMYRFKEGNSSAVRKPVKFSMFL